MPRPIPVDWPQTPTEGPVTHFLNFINGKTTYYCYRLAVETRHKKHWRAGLVCGAVVSAGTLVGAPLVFAFGSAILVAKNKADAKIAEAINNSNRTYEQAVRLVNYISIHGDTRLTFAEAEQIWLGNSFSSEQEEYGRVETPETDLACDSTEKGTDGGATKGAEVGANAIAQEKQLPHTQNKEPTVGPEPEPSPEIRCIIEVKNEIIYDPETGDVEDEVCIGMGVGSGSQVNKAVNDMMQQTAAAVENSDDSDNGASFDFGW